MPTASSVPERESTDGLDGACSDSGSVFASDSGSVVVPEGALDALLAAARRMAELLGHAGSFESDDASFRAVDLHYCQICERASAKGSMRHAEDCAVEAMARAAEQLAAARMLARLDAAQTKESFEVPPQGEVAPAPVEPDPGRERRAAEVPERRVVCGATIPVLGLEGCTELVCGLEPGHAIGRSVGSACYFHHAGIRFPDWGTVTTRFEVSPDGVWTRHTTNGSVLKVIR